MQNQTTALHGQGHLVACMPSPSPPPPAHAQPAWAVAPKRPHRSNDRHRQHLLAGRPLLLQGQCLLQRGKVMLVHGLHQLHAPAARQAGAQVAPTARAARRRPGGRDGGRGRGAQRGGI